ncbi:MAG: discoidin domain-containing protein, partial [Armatimonadetes bacterium]|nr:discoidin domain-containing protein [Armatimonadota bacterium]
MRRPCWRLVNFIALAAATAGAVAFCQEPAAGPRNLARDATVWASSEFSGAYQARFAIDGAIPELFSRDDVGRAWAVNGAAYGGKARFVLEWPEPMTVAEIIYYGRVAWLAEECWKDYEVRLDDAPEPVARGRFEMNAGPQRIKLPPTRARRVVLDFLSSYGGPNPGAAEIEVYSESPPEEVLPKLARLPINLAPRARVSASSEYSAAYAAFRAVDGQIAEPFSAADSGNAWAVDGASWGGHATFTLQWEEPVHLSQVVYYGRTAFLVEECFKDYELYLDDEPTPVAKGTLGEGSGAQPIALQPRTVRKVTLRFLSSYGGPNPGAAEIQVFDVPPPPGYLPPFKLGGWDRPEESPELTAAVREKRLGFDALVLVERHELNPSHVYTVHCEDFRPGGGLYILSPPAPDGTLRQLVASPEGQILDFDISYDAKEIVFSWRRTAAEGYHIYR